MLLKKNGFTLIELLVTISIISILAVIGTTIFSNVQSSAKDSKKKGDIQSIAKALENKYSPVTGTYTGIIGTDFAGGSIPTPPDGGTYFADLTAASTGFRTCAMLFNNSSFCVDSQQGLYPSGGEVPYATPLFGTPPGSPTPTPTPSGPTNTPGPSPTPTPPSGPSQAIFEGDSITYFYPDQAAPLLGSLWDVTNVSTPGDTIANMLITAPTQVDPLYSPTLQNNYVFVWGGTNDISGTPDTSAATYQNIVDFANGRRSLGFKVAVFTILPRSASTISPDITVAEFENRRQFINTNLRANWSSFADKLIDVAADPRIGDAGDEMDTTYYFDQVHLTSAGDAIVVNLIVSALNIQSPPAQYLGYNITSGYENSTQGVEADSGANVMYATRFTMPGQGGIAYRMGVTIVRGDTINKQYQLAIYSDSGGAPGNKIVESSVKTIIPGFLDAVNIWNNANIPLTVLNPNTTYWLVFITNGTSEIKVDFGSVEQLKYAAAPGPGSLPASFGPPIGPADIQQFIRVLYTPQ